MRGSSYIADLYFGGRSRLSFSLSSLAQGGANLFLLLEVINPPNKVNLRSINRAFIVILASMGCSTSKKTCVIEKRSTKRICLDLESEKDSLEYEKEQFNRQMKKEKEILKRAQWKSEAEIMISQEKSDKRRESKTESLEYEKEKFNRQMKKEKGILRRARQKLEAEIRISRKKSNKEREAFGSEKEVQIARAKEISKRETAMDKRELTVKKREDAVEKREEKVEEREEKVKEGFAKQRRAEEKMKEMMEEEKEMMKEEKEKIEEEKEKIKEMMDEEKEKVNEEWSGLDIIRKQLLQALKYPLVQQCATSNQQSSFSQILYPSEMPRKSLESRRLKMLNMLKTTNNLRLLRSVIS